MLYIPPELAKPIRVQGCFVADKDINRLIDYLKEQRPVDYDNTVVSQPVAIPGSKNSNVLSVEGEERDAMFNDATKFIAESGKASATVLQRHFKIGYARAARLLDELEHAGIVGPVNGAKPRAILVPHNTSSDSE